LFQKDGDNALRAHLVQRAEDWRWSNLWRRQHPDAAPPIPLADWPLPLPADWLARVNRPQNDAELEALRRCVHREAPSRIPGTCSRASARMRSKAS
jgi:putative transposase